MTSYAESQRIANERGRWKAVSGEAIPKSCLVPVWEGEAPAEPRWIAILSRFAPWITVCYLIGAFCFLLRLTIALWGGHRLRAAATRLTDSRLIELITAEARKVGLRLVPVVAYCERVAVPTVVGILRPVVLLPASIVTGLTSDEFAAIISHELAHIRRFDLWINLLQRVIESLLFFHPVVWFLSRRLSTEREICCDDLVVRSGCAPMNYAGALLRMAELCGSSRRPNLAALAFSGNEPSLLEHRIERLMHARTPPRLQPTRASFMIIAMVIVSSAAAPAMLNVWVQSDGLAGTSLADKQSSVKPIDSAGEKVDFDKLVIQLAQFSSNYSPAPEEKKNFDRSGSDPPEQLFVKEGIVLPIWSNQIVTTNGGGSQAKQSVDHRLRSRNSFRQMSTSVGSRDSTTSSRCTKSGGFGW